MSRGFNFDSVKELAKLFVDHDFLTKDEADTFVSDIPVYNEKESEPQAEVTDQLLGDSSTDVGTLLPDRPSFDLASYVDSFSESQLRAYQWVVSTLDKGKQIQAAVVGPAGTGKSYLINALIHCMRTRKLVVAKMAPSGVAAHLIGGTTIQNFFQLDIEYNSSLENGTAQVNRLRRTNVLVIDEFSMLDFYLFRTAEGLCRKFAPKGSSCHPWGGRHVILLGDPAQLPAVSMRDIFGMSLWSNFSVLLLREVKRAEDPTLASILSKIRVGSFDEEVHTTLMSHVQVECVDSIDLNKTVVICSTRDECSDINAKCLKRVQGQPVEYEAIDTDHNGHSLRTADKERLRRIRERLPDKLELKPGVRVILRRNVNIEGGWVNGTLAVVIALHKQCLVLQKMTCSSHRLPITRFKQKFEIPGAAYTIMRQQFPLQLAYAVTVHRVQGMTVQKAIIKLNHKFFETGQAYVALSRVRNLQDLVLWDYSPNAIFALQFYKDLLRWCDCVDAIRASPPTEQVPFPQRCDDTSEQPLKVDDSEELCDEERPITHLGTTSDTVGTKRKAPPPPTSSKRSKHSRGKNKIAPKTRKETPSEATMKSRLPTVAFLLSASNWMSNMLLSQVFPTLVTQCKPVVQNPRKAVAMMMS